jgi:hypothetical protein
MKRLIILSVIIFITSVVLCQTFSLQIGPSFSNLKWENSMIDESHAHFNKTAIGFNAMIGVDYLKLKYLNLSSDFGFIRKGGRDDLWYAGLELYGEEEIITVKMNYITLNTTLNFKVPIKDFVFPYVLVGPRIDYLLSYKEDLEFLKQFEDYGILNKFTYGMIAGAGIDFIIKQYIFGTGFEYYLNFNRIVNATSEWGVFNSINDRTFIIDAKIGYQL